MKVHIMFNLILLISLLFLTSCFKTAEQVKREQKIETIDRQFQDSRGLVADITVSIKDVQKKVDVLSGEVEEVKHYQKQFSPQEIKSLQETVTLLKEQFDVLKTEHDSLKSEHQSLIDSLKKNSGKTEKKNEKKSINDQLEDIQGLLKAKKYTKARAILDDLLSQDINAAETNKIYHQYGEIELKAKQPEKAITYFSKIYTKYPQSSLAASSLYHIGLCLKKIGKEEEASEAFSELKEKYPKSPFANKEK